MPLLKGETRPPCCASPPLAMPALSCPAPAGSGPDAWGPAESAKGEAAAAACCALSACACSGAVDSLCSWGAGLAEAARCGSSLGAMQSVRCEKDRRQLVSHFWAANWLVDARPRAGWCGG